MELDPHLAYSIRSRGESWVWGEGGWPSAYWPSSSPLSLCSLCGFWQEESWLSWLFEKVVVIMVCFFVCSIVNSMAQSYAKRKQQEKYSEDKTQWKPASNYGEPSTLRAPTTPFHISALAPGWCSTFIWSLIPASIWFLSCYCSNMFMLNLDFQLLSFEGFAFFSDFHYCSP